MHKYKQLEYCGSSCFKVLVCREAPLPMTSQNAAMFYICLKYIYYLYIGVHRSWTCHGLSYICHLPKWIFIVEIIQSSSLVGSLFTETHYCSNELHTRAVSDYIIIVSSAIQWKFNYRVQGHDKKIHAHVLECSLSSHSWLLKFFMQLCFLLITPIFLRSKIETELRSSCGGYSACSCTGKSEKSFAHSWGNPPTQNLRISHSWYVEWVGSCKPDMK